MSNTKKKVYLDTTIPSYLFDTRKSVVPFCQITKAWWENESQNYDLWLSDETLAELAEGNYPNKNDIIDFVKKLMFYRKVKRFWKSQKSICNIN